MKFRHNKTVFLTTNNQQQMNTVLRSFFVHDYFKIQVLKAKNLWLKINEEYWPKFPFSVSRTVKFKTVKLILFDCLQFKNLLSIKSGEL